MISPLDFLKLEIGTWEGGYQCFADDQGNSVTMPDGTVRLIGTMRGVTPLALAAYRGVPAYTLTAADMKAVTLDEAADIGLKSYYQEPHFDLLTWGPAAASLLDFAWGAGPTQAALSMQRMVGATPDGRVGPETAAAFNGWVSKVGTGASTEAIHDMRASFYRHLAEIIPGDRQFLDGWLNRAAWATSANPDFFNAFEGS